MDEIAKKASAEIEKIGRERIEESCCANESFGQPDKPT
jgi:hypothetical protein